MKLTKLQRHTAYIIMLAEAENPRKVSHPEREGELRDTTESGLCWMWKMLVGDTSLYFDFEGTLPELFDRATAPYSCWLFNDWNERKAALKQCVEETA